MARGPHLAREAVLCSPQGFFARLIFSSKSSLSIFWQIKRFKPKPSSVWVSRNQFGFAAKIFFFLFFFFFWSSPIFFRNSDQNQHRFAAKTFFFVFFGLPLLLGTDFRNTGQSEHQFYTTNLQLFGI